jgi:hypothetical protein
METLSSRDEMEQIINEEAENHTIPEIFRQTVVSRNIMSIDYDR